jgi:hypothetical protein
LHFNIYEITLNEIIKTYLGYERCTSPYLISYDNEHMKNVLMYHLEGIRDLPLSWAISQLIFFFLCYQDYPNFSDHKYHLNKIMVHQSCTFLVDELVGSSTL